MTKVFPSQSIYPAVGWPKGEARPDGVDVHDEAMVDAYVVDDFLTLEWILAQGGEAVWFHTRLDAWDDPERVSDFTIVNIVMSPDLLSLCPVLPTMNHLPGWLESKAGPRHPWPIRIPGDTREAQADFVRRIGDRVKLSIDVRATLARGGPP